MKVGEIMTEDPACCTRETSLQEVARRMVENDCGCIPVVESREDLRPVGVVTDRDICCRVVAAGKNPLELTAADCMTSPCITVTPETSVEECCQVLEENRIRRAVVVDHEGRCCGIVAQADIAGAEDDKAAEVVRIVSEPMHAPSHVGAH